MRDLELEGSYEPFTNDFTDSTNGFDFAIGLSNPYLDPRIGYIEVNEVSVRTVSSKDN